MRVLRERRGYTTNSSSAAEWSSTPHQAGTPSRPEKSIPVGTELSFGPTNSSSTSESPTTGILGGLPQSAANAVVVGAAVLLVGGLIGGEKLFRSWMNRRKR
jgi:hypothetical protein